MNLGLGMGVVYFLMTLSVQRCLILYYPTYFCIHGHKTACVLIGFVWIIAAIFATLPLVGFGFYLPEQSGLSCGPCFEHENCFAYGKFLLVFGFLVPLGIMVFSGFNIVLKLKEVKINLFSTLSKVLSFQFQHTKIQETLNQDNMAVTNREKRVTQMILLMIVAFLTAWSPYALLCILRLSGHSYPDYAVCIAMMAAKMGAWMDTTVFILLNPSVSLCTKL